MLSLNVGLPLLFLTTAPLRHHLSLVSATLSGIFRILAQTLFGALSVNAGTTLKGFLYVVYFTIEVAGSPSV